MAFSKTGSDPIAKGYEVDLGEVSDERELDTEHDVDNDDGRKTAKRRKGALRLFRGQPKCDEGRDRQGGS